MSTKKFSSVIWKYFLIVNDECAKCKICDGKYSRKGKGTTSLKNHLQRKHPEEYDLFLKEDAAKKRTDELPRPGTSLQTVKREFKQTFFDEYMEKTRMWDNTNPKSIKIDYLIAEMLALSDLPFQHVEQLGFRRLMDHIVPNYVLKGRKYFTELVCSELYDKVSSKIKNMLQDFDKVSFTSDIWSDSSSGVSLLSLTCHGITEDFQRKNIVLKANVLEERHTGDYISEIFQSMLNEWGIQKQNVHCMVRDGGSNMKRACSLSEIHNIDCTAHQLHLVVKEAIKKVDTISVLLAKCRKIAGHFNHSTMAKQELEKIQVRLNQKVLKVLQDSPTRWNSSYHMLERLDCIKDSLSLYASNNKIDQFNADDWTLIQDLVKVLKPLDDITKTLSSQNSCISDVIPLVRALNKIYDEIQESLNISVPSVLDFVSALKNELDYRFSEVDKNILFQVATFLDPRYKSKFFSDILIKQIKEKLRADLETEQSLTATTSTGVKQIIVRKEHSQSLQDSIANMLDSDDDAEQSENQISDAKANLLAEYMSEKRLPRDQDQLKYWQINNKRFGCLSSIARTYLSSPATSVPSEQFFSAAGIVYDPHRNRLLGDKAAKLLFLKYNLPLLNFNYDK
ncbi:zinc finger BED domain-containing protein 4-like [Spodoptera litura]|uniref:Zinc finger BED domain-containing protein 4-like n=1 Tax=Spodoptera litura TaxID=69820 RepID=A0A9J7ETL5_SPOLT|nr:zinc finger BED domain-containing protein 4-like [Spodoptera litura]